MRPLDVLQEGVHEIDGFIEKGSCDEKVDIITRFKTAS